MSESEHMSLADFKNRLSEVVDRLEREHGRVVDSAELMADIRGSLAEVASGAAEVLTKDEARRLISGQ